MLTMICKSCGKETSATSNDRCMDCAAIATEAWRKKMAIRMDPAQFDIKKLIGVLLTEHWMHECKIIPDYMPPFPSTNTQPTCQVRFTYDDGTTTGLRYSKGPAQGYFWDVYGEDFHTPELALCAISQAPAPPRVGTVIPTHGAV